MVTTVNIETEEVEATNSETQTDIGKPPGVMLREARFARDLSEADVANKLNLSRSMIQAIENDDYEKLPGSTFIRGYLRSYARLVDMSGDDIVAAYNLTCEEEEHLPVMAPVTKVRKQVRAGDKSVRWATYLIVAVLVALVIMWWRNHNDGVADIASDPALAIGSEMKVEDTHVTPDSIPVQPISGQDVSNAIGNEQGDATTGPTGTSEKVLNSDKLRDKKPRRSASNAKSKTQQAQIVASNDLSARLKMSGFDT